MDNKRIWFKSPAEDWNVALPVGNGRIGGMCFGAFLSFMILHESLTIVYLIALAVMITGTAFVVSDTMKQK